MGRETRLYVSGRREGGGQSEGGEGGGATPCRGRKTRGEWGVCLATAGPRNVADSHGMCRRHWRAAAVLACMRMMNQPAVAADVPGSSAKGPRVCSGPLTTLGVPRVLSWCLVRTTSVGAGLFLQDTQLHVKCDLLFFSARIKWNTDIDEQDTRNQRSSVSYCLETEAQTHVAFRTDCPSGS